MFQRIVPLSNSLINQTGNIPTYRQEGLLTWRRRNNGAEETREVRGAEETQEVREAGEAREIRGAKETREVREATEAVEKW